MVKWCQQLHHDCCSIEKHGDALITGHVENNPTKYDHLLEESLRPVLNISYI